MPSSRLILEGSSDQQFGNAPMLRRDRTGWRGRLEYIVDTSNPYEAIVSSGVPTLGATFTYPDVPPIGGLICVDQDYKYHSRKDQPDGTGAIGVVVNEYAELGAGGSLPPPTLGQKFTVLQAQTETQTVFYERRASLGGTFAEPLANGDGFARKVGTITAQVYVYLPLSSWPNMSRLLRLSRHKKLNSDAFTLPLILGTSVSLNIAVGQAQYEGFTHEVKNQLIEFKHEISLAEDFIFYWQKEDEEGNAFASMISEIYDSEPFTGLF